MARTALRRLAPSDAATAIARITVGNANTKSAMRITVSSTQRPKKPAQAPRRLPMTTDKTTSSSVSGIESRAPYRTRLNTSRPRSSVPNQCAPFGALSRGNFWASGS